MSAGITIAALPKGITEEVTQLKGAKLYQDIGESLASGKKYATGTFTLRLENCCGLEVEVSAAETFSRLATEIKDHAKKFDFSLIKEVTLPDDSQKFRLEVLTGIAQKTFPKAVVELCTNRPVALKAAALPSRPVARDADLG